MKKFNFLIVTLGRVDWNIWSPILNNLKKNKKINLKICATAMHFDDELGNSCREILKSGYKINFKLNKKIKTIKTPKNQKISSYFEYYVGAFSKIYTYNKIDYILLVGDRFESLAAATSSIPFRIPIFHFHGGELSEGSIDEINRHMITKASHVHLVSTDRYAKRVNQLGEKKWRIKNIGASSLNNIQYNINFSKEKFYKKFDFHPQKKLFIINFNSESLNYSYTKKQINIVFKSLDSFDANILFTLTNYDYASSIINQEIKKYCKNNINCKWTNFLGEDYFNVLRISDLMVGNSSSGILEASHLKLPVINIGDRQKGRLKDQNVINARFNVNEIKKKITFSQKIKFKNKIKKLKSSYFNKNFMKLNKFINEYIKKDKKYLLNKIFYDL